MTKLKKKLRHTFQRRRRSKDEDCRKPLVNNTASQLTEPVDEDSITQTSPNSAVQPETEPERHIQDADAEGQKLLSTLRNVLLEDLGSQEQPAEEIKRWAKQNGITPDGKAALCSPNWLTDYLEIVEMSVEKHFPIRPPEGPKDSYQQTLQYLNSALRSVRREVFGLTPVLEDAGLLGYLVDSYNHRLLAVLEVLMDRSSSVEEAFLLLHWAKQTYFSHGFKDSSNIQDGVIRVSDPLLLTHWFEKSKQKLLILIQENISIILQKILQYNEAPCEYKNEEDFIKVYLDVIQCLDATLQSAKLFSHTLTTAVQRLCCDELHSFVQRYVNNETKRLEEQKSDATYSLHSFRIIDTCKHLRSYAQNIMDSNSDKDSSTLLTLQNMEVQVLAILQQWLAGLAEEHLKMYFKENDIHIHNLMDMIQSSLAPLPQRDEGEGTQQLLVKVAYQTVTRAYLRCLLQRKCRQMEKRWGDVDKIMMKDAELIHSTFKKLMNTKNVTSVCDDDQKMFLLKMIEILGCNDTNTLKLICAPLYRHFPKESEEHLHALLKWKGISRRHRKEILDVSQEACERGGHDTPQRVKYWSCCLCCT